MHKNKWKIDIAKLPNGWELLNGRDETYLN